MRRFEALDGLRGLAALFVVWLHGCEFFHSDLRPSHASLAVDFFFCLSGFVISHAYDQRVGRGMTFFDFCIKRLIRLYPMIAIGVLLGGVALYISTAIFHDMSVSDCLLFTLTAFFLLPVGLLKHLQAYPVNNPIWSLFFELFANFVYAIERKFCRLGLKTFSVLVALSFVILAVLAVRKDGIEGLGFTSFSSFTGGFFRVTFPFFVGVALHRFNIYEKLPKINPLWAFCGLAVVLALPIHTNKAAYDIISVAIAIPLIVALAAHSEEKGKAVLISRYLGEISYPLYLIHQPIIRMSAIFYDYLGLHMVAKEWAILVTTLLCVGLSIVAARFLDKPIRTWLSRNTQKFVLPVGK